MKRVINFSTTLLALTSLISFIPQVSPVNAQEIATQKCFNGLFYQFVNNDIKPRSNLRTVVNDITAAEVCRGVVNLEEVKQARKCVLGSLYKYTKEDGTPRTDTRTELSLQAVAKLCAKEKPANVHIINQQAPKVDSFVQQQKLQQQWVQQQQQQQQFLQQQQQMEQRRLDFMDNHKQMMEQESGARYTDAL